MSRLPSVIGGLGLSLLVAGCISIPSFGRHRPPPPLPPPPPVEAPKPPPAPVTHCEARQGGWAVGQQASSAMVERLTLATGSANARVVRPGQPVTMDFSPDR